MTGKKTTEEEVRDIGDRLELFVDPWLIGELNGTAVHRLHEPVPRNIALKTDAPWEGNRGGYITVFEDDGVFRMYYFAHHTEIVEEPPGKYIENQAPLKIAYAESKDGIEWTKPELGLYEVEGTTRNNIVWKGVGPAHIGTHGFAPFRDTNPDAKPDGHYKALGTKHGEGAESGLYAMQSPDGIHWKLMQDSPVMTKGKFDSQNLGFWDSVGGMYRAYFRDFHEGKQGESIADDMMMGIRDIRTCISSDFVHWSDPEPLTYTGSFVEALYINQIAPYYRAPHIFLGFPARYVERAWTKAIELLPGLEERKLRSAVSTRFGTVVTDGRFMASRDGKNFHMWPQVFIRPGPQLEGNWIYGDNYQCWGLYETASSLPGAPKELSFVASENYWRTSYTIIRRYSIRVDGFASIWANSLGGELLTKPLRFSGEEFYINFSSAAAGRIKVAIEDVTGGEVEGFGLADSIESIGDELDRRVYWKDGRRPGTLAGKPVRLRFDIKDADLFAIRFR